MPRYFGFWYGKNPPGVDQFCKEQQERAERQHRERLDGLRRKYHDVPLHWAVIQLIREGGLTHQDMATVMQTDIDTIGWEVERARQNAR